MTKDNRVENQDLGDLVTTARQAQGRSARDVAREAGIDIHTMTMLEKGRYASPSPITLKGVAKALDIPLLKLFEAAGYVTVSDVVQMARDVTTVPAFDSNHIAENERFLNNFIAQHGDEFEESATTRATDPEAIT